MEKDVAVVAFRIQKSLYREFRVFLAAHDLKISHAIAEAMRDFMAKGAKQ